VLESRLAQSLRAQITDGLSDLIEYLLGLDLNIAPEFQLEHRVIGLGMGSSTQVGRSERKE